MYTKLLSVIAIIEIMWGTIFSVLREHPKVCVNLQTDVR